MQAMMAVYLLGILISRIFFGTLRAAESEVNIDYVLYILRKMCVIIFLYIVLEVN